MTDSGAHIWSSFSPDLYYRAAATSVALATGSVRELRRWLAEHGS